MTVRNNGSNASIFDFEWVRLNAEFSRGNLLWWVNWNRYNSHSEVFNLAPGATATATLAFYVNGLENRCAQIFATNGTTKHNGRAYVTVTTLPSDLESEVREAR